MRRYKVALTVPSVLCQPLFKKIPIGFDGVSGIAHPTSLEEQVHPQVSLSLYEAGSSQYRRDFGR